MKNSEDQFLQSFVFADKNKEKESEPKSHKPESMAPSGGETDAQLNEEKKNSGQLGFRFFVEYFFLSGSKLGKGIQFCSFCIDFRLRPLGDSITTGCPTWSYRRIPYDPNVFPTFDPKSV